MLLAVAGCSGGDPDTSIQFDGEFRPSQPWTATGELVDAGAMCPGGFRRLVGWFDADGMPLSADDFFTLVDEAATIAETGGRFETDLLNEQEWICADGSGSFTMMETIAETGEWRVVRGTGAYAAMTGHGTFAWVRAPAPSGPEDPPEGEPIAVRAEGTLEFTGEPPPSR